MSNLITPDGFLARHPDGMGYALAVDQHYVGDDDVYGLNISSGASIPEVQVLGRSALGIVTGIDVVHEDRLTICQDGLAFVPISLRSYTDLGERLIENLGELKEDFQDGEAVRWDDYKLPFGRLLRRGGLIQLGDAEIKEALFKRFIAHGEIESDRMDGDIRVEDDALNLPIERLELVPNFSKLRDIQSLRPMLQDGESARAFAFENMHVEKRSEIHEVSKFVVGSTLFSPGPFYCEVVRLFTPDSGLPSLPQLPSAAWLDAHRSPGLRKSMEPGRVGRQFEVTNLDYAEHSWLDMRVEIKIFRAGEGYDHRYLADWNDLSVQSRMEKHRKGYSI